MRHWVSLGRMTEDPGLLLCPGSASGPAILARSPAARIGGREYDRLKVLSAAMGSGAIVAGFGGGTSLVGVGMQAVGGITNGLWGGGWRSAVSAGVQALGAAAKYLLDKALKQLPDALGSVNPVDKAADKYTEKLSGAGTCP